MKADLGTVSFDPAKHFQRVVLQQGRAQLESDWNEQVAIQLDGLRTLAADLIGPWGGSAGAFTVPATGNDKNNFLLGPGHYYVDGIRIVNEPAPGENVSYRHQPFAPSAEPGPLAGKGGAVEYLAYLDVWERLITAAEDDAIREVALGGADTSARTQVVWQVRVHALEAAKLAGLTCQNAITRWRNLRRLIWPGDRGLLRARARVPQEELDRPCAIDPNASYRGAENALIRVEVHTPGQAGYATFKWSFDNGAVTFPIASFGGTVVSVTTLGRDPRLGLAPGDWVELEDDATVLRGETNPLFQVADTDPTELTVTLDRAPAPSAADLHPRLRRWDQKGTRTAPLTPEGTAKITEQAGVDGPWLSLGQGVQISFVAPDRHASAHYYRTGDYWLIPARTAIGDVVWPQEEGGYDEPSRPAARPPAGVEHHYAPLAWLSVATDGTVTVKQSLTRRIQQLAIC